MGWPWRRQPGGSGSEERFSALATTDRLRRPRPREWDWWEEARKRERQDRRRDPPVGSRRTCRWLPVRADDAAAPARHSATGSGRRAQRPMTKTGLADACACSPRRLRRAGTSSPKPASEEQSAAGELLMAADQEALTELAGQTRLDDIPDVRWSSAVCGVNRTWSARGRSPRDAAGYGPTASARFRQLLAIPAAPA